MEELLDINDVERITKIKKATLRRYVLLKQIPFYKVIKAIRFKASEIDEWVKNNGNLKKAESGPFQEELPFAGNEGGIHDDGHGQGH